MPLSDTNTPAHARLPIKLRSVPAPAGLRWIQLGFIAFKHRPGGFLGLFGLVLLSLLLLVLTPPIVQFFALVLMPLLSLGFMIATHAVLNAVPVRPRFFWIPLTTGQQQRQALLQIGLVYAAAALLIYFFGDLIDNGEAKRWMEAALTPPSSTTRSPPTPLSGLATLVLMLKTFGVGLVSIPLWHAPALVYWGGHSAAQAMFSSVIAVWRTRGAFALYLLGWAAIGIGFLITVMLLATLSGGLQLAVALMTPVSWALSAVFYATIWFSFVDTFFIEPPQPQPTNDLSDS